MKKNELTNRKLVSALTVGISAMMALATPITAYANGEAMAPPADDNQGNATETSSTAEQSAPAESVTQDAQDQADVVQEVTAGEEKQAEAGEAQDQLQSAKVEANDAAQAILSSETGAAAGEAGGTADAVIEAANAIVNDGENDPSALTSLDNASKKAAEVKQDLNDAGEADKEADKQATVMENEGKAAMENVKYASEKAEHMVQDSIETQEKADALIEAIKGAENSDDASKAYEDLEKLVDDTQKTLSAMQQFYESMTKQYEEAVKNLKEAEEKLEKAEQDFGDRVNAADEKTQEAQQDIEAARQKVENLAGALDVVEDKIDDAKDAEAMAKASKGDWSTVIGSVDQNRRVMESVVENYFLEQKLGIEVVKGEGYEFKWEYIKDGTENDEGLKSMDRQEFNYAKVTYYYRNDEGEIVKGVKYFNWDNAMKQNSEGNWFSGVNATNGSGAIVVFEKTQEEIDANNYLLAKYAGTDVLTKDSVWRAKANSGAFNIYVYEENGEKIYRAQDEVDQLIADGVIEKDAEGNMKLKGTDITLRRVYQNQNNLFYNGDCLVIGNANKIEKFTTAKKSTIADNNIARLGADKVAEIKANSMAVNAFIADSLLANEDTTELSTKYSAYETATEKAQQAVAVAQQEADNLSDAIDDLKNQKKRSVLAVKALGVDDIATYFGFEVSQERADELNSMTVKQVLSELDKMLEESNQKVETAQKNLEKLQSDFGQAKTDLDNTLLRLNPKRPATASVSESVANAAGEVAAENAANARRAAPVAATAQVQAPDEVPSQEAAPVAVDQRRAARQAYENAQTVDAAGGAEEAAAVEETTTIEDGGVALAEKVEAETEEVKESKNAAAVTIEDEDTALGVLEDDVKEEGMGFWWLLIIAILGEAGREMYVKHKEKKEAKVKARRDD